MAPPTPMVDKDLPARLAPGEHHLTRLPSQLGACVASAGKSYAEVDDATRRRIVDVVARMPLFDGTFGNMPFSREQVEKVAEAAMVEPVNQRDVLQMQGDLVDQIWIVLDGCLVKFHRENGADNVMEYVESGGQVGLLHVFGSDIASSTVLVDSPKAEVAVIEKSALMEVLDANSEMVLSLIAGLSRALRAQTRRSKNSRLVRYVDHLKASQADPSLTTTGIASEATIKFFSAALSALGSLTLTFPLDTTRTRLQTEGRGDILYGLQVLKDLVLKEGFGACYAGWGTAAASHTLQNVAFHSAYDKLTHWFEPPSYAGSKKPVMSDLLKFALGLCSGFYSAFFVCPLHVLSFKLQGKAAQGKSLLQVVLQTVREDGVLSFWHGLGPALVLALNPTITFYSFDIMKSFILNQRAKAQAKQGAASSLRSSFDRRKKEQIDLPKQCELSPLETLCIAAAAKSIASAVTFPFMMAKIRMGLYGKKRYPDMLSTISTVLREEGADGLFKGVGISLLRSIIVAALEFLLREKIHEALRRILSQKTKVQ